MNSKQFLSSISKFSTNSDSIKVSHTSLDPPCRLRVQAKDEEAFLESYCELYGSCSELHLGEVLGDVRPLLIDIDISRPSQMGDEEGCSLRLYSKADVEHTVSIIQDAVEDAFQGCDRMDELQRCVYLEKPAYISREKYKNGFHLHFPYLFSNRKVFEDNIFPQISELINEYYDHKYGYKQVVDSKVSTWLMYGSNKPAEKYRYQAKAVYECNGVESGLESLKGYSINLGNEVSVENVERWLPYILSTKPVGRREVTSTIPLRRSHLFKTATRDDSDEKVDYSQNHEIVQKLLPLISDARASDYHSWIRVGWAIRAACGPSQESLQMWLDFSARCPSKYNERACVQTWSTMNPRNISIGTLKHYAREDSPSGYSDVTMNHDSDSTKLKSALSCTHYDVASYLYHEFGSQFICASHMRKVWYHFENHHWKEMDGAVDLLACITDIVIPMLIQQHFKIKQAGSQAGDNANSNQLLMDKYWKLITKIKDVNYKASLVKECSQLFYVEKIDEKMDANPELICFQNGVYDFVEKQLRPGLPSDYLTKQMPINYRTFDMFGKEVAAVQQYLQQVFPDIEIREYFITVNSAVFRGGNMDKKIFVWSGAGNNAKSITQKLFESMLGYQYAKSLSPAVINNGRPNSGQASPDIARIGGGVRQVFVQEPAKNKEINVDVLKQLSGNDRIFARDLYESGKDKREMCPMFKFAIICNELPDMPTADKATWNRVRVVPFESTFADDAPNDPEEQMRTKTFPIDRRFESKIDSMLEPLAFMFIERFNKTDGVPEYEPEKVRAATDLYQKCNDLIGLFISDMVEKAEGYSITPNEMFGAYKLWFKDNSASSSMPTLKTTNEQLKVRMKIKTADYEGYRLKSVDGLL